ncbi:hypothetical protein ACFSJ3_04175 [Corallincola platygyrae]|uniref:PEP-CTERM sorting domain-containing protein n=1 Tax=Corallincola platygyrae TaxID=1193278 RepID=A0ABW4XK94_9GAMM
MIRAFVVLMLTLFPLAHAQSALLQFSFDGILADGLPNHGPDFSGWIIVDSEQEEVEAVFSNSGDTDYFWLRSNPMVRGSWDLPFFEYDDFLGSFVLVIEGFTEGANNPDELFDIYLDIELEGPDDALQNRRFDEMYVAEFGSFGNFINGSDGSDAYFDNLMLDVVDAIPQVNTPAPTALILASVMLIWSGWRRRA